QQEQEQEQEQEQHSAFYYKPKPAPKAKPYSYPKLLLHSYSFMADIDSLETTVFDAIVLGTGFTQTIVAAALSRAGKTVLHLDENDYYGGESGAFGFRELMTWLDKVVLSSAEPIDNG